MYSKNNTQQQGQSIKMNKNRKTKTNRKKRLQSSLRTRSIPNSSSKQHLSIDKNQDKLIYLLKESYFPSSIGLNLDPKSFILNYSLMSNMDYEQHLFKTITDENQTNVLTCIFQDKEIVTFVRELTQHVNQLNYSKLQYEQWNYYYHLGTTEGIWHGSVSKKMALMNSMCHTYGRHKSLIIQRQKYFQLLIDTLTKQLTTLIEQAPHSLDVEKLMDIIRNFIDQEHQYLRIELQRRKHLLNFDAQDHKLVQQFYDLKPRQTEVSEYKAKHMSIKFIIYSI